MTIQLINISSPATTSMDNNTNTNNGIVDAARNLDCLEKMMGIISVFKSLPFLHKRLLHLLLGNVMDNISKSSQFTEEQENEDELVKQEPVDVLLNQLCHLPNKTADSTTKQARLLFSQAMDDVMTSQQPFDRMQLQQLLIISGLHPAFTDVERAKFAETASFLEYNHNSHCPLLLTTSLDVPSSPTTTTGSSSPLTPNSLSPQNSLNITPDNSNTSTTTHLYSHQHPPLQCTFSAPPAARIPGYGAGPKLSLPVTSGGHDKIHRSLSSSPSTGESENNNPSNSDSNSSLCKEEDTFLSYVHIPPKPGMRDVPLWLKGLRLHKYCSLLAGRSYDELLSVGETQLEAWNVTKGARHKIAMCIEKLRQRPDDLCRLGKQLSSLQQVRLVLHELRDLLSTPIRQAPNMCLEIGKVQRVEDVPPEDLAGRFVLVFRKAANIYLSAMASQQPIEDDCSNLFIQLADRCIRHEAFYGALKSTLVSIKQSLHASLRAAGFHGHRKVVKSYTSLPLPSSTFNNNSTQSTGMYPKGQENGAVLSDSFFLSVPETFNRPSLQHRALHRTQAIGKCGQGQAPLQQHDMDRLAKPKVALFRAKSAPMPAKALSAVESNLWFDGLDPDLETLTLSVTEHALDSFEEHLNF